jgi:hypothetical protein
MPRIDLPRSDLKRQAFLQQAASTAAGDQLNGRFYLSPATLFAVNELERRLSELYIQHTNALGARSAAVRQANQAQAVLVRQLRDLWELVRRRVRAEGEPVSVLYAYQLREHGPKPCPGTRQAWISLAEAVISGDALARASGAPAPAYPTIEMVQASLQRLCDCQEALLLAQRRCQAIQQALVTLRPQVDYQIRYLLAELRLALFERDEPGYRRVARSYGASYRPLAGEAVEEDDEEETGEQQAVGEQSARLPAASAARPAVALAPVSVPVNVRAEVPT